MLCLRCAQHSSRICRVSEDARIDTQGVAQDSAAACKVPVGVLSHVDRRSLQSGPRTVR